MKRIAVPKRFSLPMRELVMLQTRFERRSGRRALRLLEHPRFRAAYDFLLLRAEAGEVDPRTRRLVDRHPGHVARRSASRGRGSDGHVRRAGAADGKRRVAAVAAASSPRTRAGLRFVTAAPARDDTAGRAAHWMPAYVALGSNLDDPQRQVERAFEALARLPADPPGAALAASIARVRWGPVAQPDFVNAAAGLLTQLDARDAAAATQGARDASSGAPHRSCAGARGSSTSTCSCTARRACRARRSRCRTRARRARVRPRAAR